MSDEALSHFDASGAARMVGIDDKEETSRMATARARIRMQPGTLERIRGASVDKGDVLGVARLAAIGAVKATAQLVPLCHPVRVTGVDVRFEVVADLPGIEAVVEVRAIDRTGPDMEAMTGASVAALTIYDMCKGIDRGMTVQEVCLLEKRGGKSGTWIRP